MSPLVPFHNALYTALDAISGLAAYSFIPDEPTFPYVYIDRKQSRGQDTNRDRGRYALRSKLFIATNSVDINVIGSLVEDVEDALASGLTLAGDWDVIIYDPIPDTDIFPVTNFDGSPGHAAEIFHDFLIQSTV